MLGLIICIIGVIMLLLAMFDMLWDIINTNEICLGLIVIGFTFIMIGSLSMAIDGNPVYMEDSKVIISGPAVFVNDGEDIKLRYKDKEYSTGGDINNQYKVLTDYYKNVILDTEEDLIKEVDKNNRILEDLSK